LKTSNLSTILIVLLTVGLVSAPTLRSGLRVEIAKWYLAAAANSVELNQGDGESQFKQAERWNPGIVEFQDYWSIRIKQAKKQSPEKLAEMAKQGPSSLRRFIGMDVVAELVKMQEFDLAASTSEWLRSNEPEILKNLYFWQLLVQIDYQSPAESTAMLSRAPGATRAIERLQEAIAYSDSARLLAILYSRIFTQKHEFEPALEALKLGLGKDFDRNSNNLNQLAYIRSLAIVDLDEALKDINEAIEKIPPGITQLAEQSALRDTRAWVLYRMGKYDDAFLDADFAVRTTERPSIWQRMANTLESLAASSSQDISKELGVEDKVVEAETADSLPDSNGPVKSEYLEESEVEPAIWSVGVMRYHRAKILEKLGRSEDAQADWEWIKSHRLPPDDRLH
jgi:tetratricopeptide (TPR) repeat protein